MTENYIQYAGGYQKENIVEADLIEAINNIQSMDDEHGAFWVSIITDDECVVEVNKDLSLSVIFEGEERKYQAANWVEVQDLYKLLLDENFHELIQRVK